MMRLCLFLTIICVYGCSGHKYDRDLNHQYIPEERALLGKYFYTTYTRNGAARLGTAVFVGLGNRRTLKLTSTEFKDSMWYAFKMGISTQRMVVTCKVFNIPCNEGNFVIKSNGCTKRYCGYNVPFNIASVTSYIGIRFEGNGKPYTGSLTCFISGVKKHQAEFSPSFRGICKPTPTTPPPPTTTPPPCPAMVDPSVYGTVLDCDCGVEPSGIISDVRASVMHHKDQWMALIRSASSDKFVCMGSLISDQWVITAATCFYGTHPSYLTVSLGNDKHTSTGKVFQVIDMVDIGYNPFFPRVNDILLLKLSEPADIANDNTILPICLPNPCIDFEGSTATVGGWGYVDGDGVDLSNALHITDVTIGDQDSCNITYDYHINGEMICAGNPTSSDCIRNTGAPLWHGYNGGRKSLIGVLSWSNGCNAPTPDIYTRITEYLPDIQMIIYGTGVCRAI